MSKAIPRQSHTCLFCIYPSSSRRFAFAEANWSETTKASHYDHESHSNRIAENNQR